MNNSTKKEGAFFHQEVLLVDYKYKLSKRRYLKSSLMLFSKKMITSGVSNNDMIMFLFTQTYPVIYSSGVVSDYFISVSDMYIDNEDKLVTYGIGVNNSFLINKNKANLNFKYQIKKNIQSSDKKRDSSQIDIVGLYNYLYSKNIILSPMLGYTRDIKKYSTTTDVDKNILNTSVALKYIFSKNIIFNQQLSYLYSKYSDEDSSYLKKREDNLFTIKFGYTLLFNRWVMQGDISYLDQVSNLKPYSYNKYIANISLVRSF